MPNGSRKTIFTTISIDKETAALVEKICKRYSLKKSEVVKLAFGYIDKAHINPSEAPESVKSELAKINKRQDDIIRFIRHYEEEQQIQSLCASMLSAKLWKLLFSLNWKPVRKDKQPC